MNTLYYGDNLGVLRESIADASVDLVYLDPPFNSQAVYNVLFREPNGAQTPGIGGDARIEAFTDTWTWGEEAEQACADVLGNASSPAAATLQGLRAILKESAMMAYLAMMAGRMVELRQVLKTTGSLYLTATRPRATISRC
jgi:site-specific DNA-methyltransferase (adenine-specific)